MNVISALSTAIQQFRDGLILSKWVNTDLMDDRRFLLKYNDSENFITHASVFR